MNFFRLFGALCAVCLLPAVSFAASKEPLTREFPSIMKSVAAMGMGNAFYGKSDDKYAGFYNPAGLGKVDHWSVDIIPITVGMNDHFIDNGLSSIKDFGKLDNPDVVSKLINKFIGTYNNVGPVTFYPAFTKKNFSVGIFTANEANLLAYNRVLPELALRVKSDNGAIVSFAMQFLEDDALSIGVSLKGLYRVNFTKSYTATEIVGLFSQGSSSMDALKREITREGAGWAVLGTVGVMYDLPFWKKTIKPRIGVSFNDFGYTDFGKLMEGIDPTLNVSLAISPGWKFISSDIVVDFNDVIMMAGSDKSFSKRVNIGAEIGFWDKVFLRVGLHQGYLTAGAGLDLRFVRVNYAYYTEEMGAYAGQYKDTRHVLELVIGL